MVLNLSINIKMSNGTENPNKIIWNCTQIAENASNWSLESDVNLLKFLETFSEKIFESAQKVDENLNKLSTKLDETSINLHLARNEFSSLSNTQFIESRVYEEDETILDENDNKSLNEHVIEQKDSNEDLKVAAQRGLEIISKYYDKVDVNIESDSEDEDEIPGFILQPKDPYINRPLPYVIGTEEWYKSSLVGILDSDSESDEEKISDRYSDDSESDRNDNEEKVDSINSIESKSDEWDDERLPSDNVGEVSFAEQLAEKLGNVISNDKDIREVIGNDIVNEVIVNKRPIQKVTSDYGKLFSNEPPPIDDDDLFPKKSPKGLFSTGNGLFDDLEDDVGFWGENSTPKKTEDNNKFKGSLFDDDLLSEDQVVNKIPKKPLQLKKNLFDDDSTDDEDFFAPKNDVKQNLKEDKNIFDDRNVIEQQSDDLFGSEEKNNLFESKEKKEDFLNNNKNVKNKKENKNNVSSLFSDSDSDDLFYTKPKILKKKLIDQNENNKNDEIKKEIKIDKGEEKIKSFFDNDWEEEDENDLFGSNFSGKDDLKKEIKSESKDVKNDLFNTPVIFNDPPIIDKAQTIDNPPSIFDDPPIIIDKPFNEQPINPSIFDDPPIIIDKPFNERPINPSIFNEPPPIITPTFNDIPSTKNIFDDIPPTKNIFDETFDEPNDEVYSYFGNNDEEINKKRFETQRSSIFDDEPPLIFTETTIDSKMNSSVIDKAKINNENDEKKKTVRFEENFDGENEVDDGGVLGVLTSPGKLKHNLNINVKALLPGAAPAFIKSGLTQKSKSLFDVSSTNDLRDENEEKPVVLSVEEKVEVLTSITKSRARIPVRRRPSTKKGREAIRKSCIEFSAPNDIDEEDASKDVKIDSESDLFTEQKFKLPKIDPNKSKSSLFDDDDDDDDVFFSNINQSKKVENKVGVDKSMGESSMIRKAVISSIKKLENVKVTQDDPLNAFDR